jgi:hypothetical protein
MKYAIYAKVILLLLAGFILFEGCTGKKCIEHPREDCVCTMQYDPVCGCNNKTYGNACMAECMGIMDYSKGPCDQP